ncbi:MULTISPECIES: hypothetical protein [Paenibacillus]|uniref:hypothetical protein n=1 Tax=Paenibacillus TaxID=44249 RepID=UPI0004B3F492|nr:hypothetical protein [Paenibacillus gorillae]
MERYIGKVVQLIYLDRKRNVSIRNVQVISVKNGRMKGYCLSAQAIRIFNLDGIVDVELAGRGGGGGLLWERKA